MIVEKLTFPTMNDVQKWFSSPELQETIDILTKSKWEGEAKLRLHFYGREVRGVVIRGSNSLAKTEHPIGSLVNEAYVENNIAYFDDVFWADKFGKTCVFTNDAPIYQLFMKGKKRDIHPAFTESNLISKIAMGRVLSTIGIDFEYLDDADIILLPSRDKFSCGYSRALYCDPKDRDNLDTQMVRYEGGWISYRIDHDLFQEILPEVEYNRDNCSDPNHGGIDGIENKYPTFDREEFYNRWFEEIAKYLGEDIKNITIVEKVIS